uniref:Serpin family E member 3 n=1 Tax=Apteryx owenii TaxID=8824 RepID=A0A8B9PBN0_APTOW
MLPIFFAAFILATCCLTKGDCISHDEMKELKTEFAINLYQHMAEGENRTSLVVSPASVVVSLELLQFGAQGNTFKELRDALGYSIHDQSVQGFLHMMYEGATGSSSQGTVVRQACSLFVQAGVQLWPRFVARTACWANSSLQQANFRDPNTTAAQIQEWITSNTGDGPTGTRTAPSPLNQVAVVSTMYFKSTWQKKFSFMDTQILPFTTAEGSTLKVPTMHKTAEVNYGNYPCSRSGILYNMQELYVLTSHNHCTKITAYPSLLSLVTTHLQGTVANLQGQSLQQRQEEFCWPLYPTSGSPQYGIKVV